MIRVVLGLGSNLGNRKQNILDAVSQFTFLQNIKQSSFYKSQALLPDNAPPDWDIEFLNIAVSGDTSLEPSDLLGVIKNIEKSIGRAEVYRKWSPRVIDIDVLIYGNQYIQTPNLVIPHAELFNRNFALQPAKEIEPELINQLFQNRLRNY